MLRVAGSVRGGAACVQSAGKRQLRIAARACTPLARPTARPMHHACVRSTGLRAVVACVAACGPAAVPCLQVPTVARNTAHVASARVAAHSRVRSATLSTSPQWRGQHVPSLLDPRGVQGARVFSSDAHDGRGDGSNSDGQQRDRSPARAGSGRSPRTTRGRGKAHSGSRGVGSSGVGSSGAGGGRSRGSTAARRASPGAIIREPTPGRIGSNGRHRGGGSGSGSSDSDGPRRQRRHHRRPRSSAQGSGGQGSSVGARAQAPRDPPVRAPVDLASPTVLMRYFDHPFPHELRRLLINASAHCAPSRLHSTGQELQRMSFLAAICRDNPDAVRELATDSYISNLAQRFRASSEQSTHVATLVMRVLVQAGTDTCVEVLERIAAAVHNELTKRARHIDRRAATARAQRGASSSGGGVAGELDGNGDMGVETALWVEEQRVQVADHLAELRAITSAPRGVCILDWASPAHPPEAFSRFEREMLFASPSVLDTLWSTRAARRVVHNMFGTGSRTGTPPPLPVDIAASPAARLAEYLQQHSGTDMAALRSPATVQAVQTAAHARVALTHADMIPGSYAAMHVPRPTSATHSVSGPAADALHKHRAVVEPAAVDLASVLPIDLRPAPIPLPDSMRAPSGVHRGPGLLLGFLANDVAGAVVAGLWGHFAATGDVAVVDRVAELVTALGTVLSHKEWCSIVEDVGVSKYTVSGPVVALEKAAELASTMVGDKYGSDNPANLQQRLVLFAGFSALRSLQENVVRYPEVRHRVACMLDLQDLGGEGSEGLRGLTAAHTPVPAPNAATKSSAGRAAGDDEVTTSSVGSTRAEPESPPVFMGPEAGMVQLSMVPLLLAPPAADSSSERGM